MGCVGVIQVPVNMSSMTGKLRLLSHDGAETAVYEASLAGPEGPLGFYVKWNVSEGLHGLQIPDRNHVIMPSYKALPSELETAVREAFARHGQAEVVPVMVNYTSDAVRKFVKEVSEEQKIK